MIPIVPFAMLFVASTLLGVVVMVLALSGPAPAAAPAAALPPAPRNLMLDPLAQFTPTKIIKLDKGGLLLFSLQRGQLVTRFVPPARSASGRPRQS